MARRTKHDAQVDPFNAGEPTLPWDEPPSPFGEDDQTAEECAFGGEPYDSPTKEPDNYNAPAANDEQDPVASADPMSVRGLFSLNKSGMQDKGNDKASRERRRTSVNEPGGPSTPDGALAPAGASHRQSTKRRARQDSSQNDPSKTNKPRRSIIRTIILAILFINLVPIACSGAISVLDEFIFSPSDDSSHDEPAYTPSDDDFSSDGVDENPEESPDGIAKQECMDIATTRLDAVSSADSPERERIVEFLSTYYANSLGYTAEELGIDAEAFADWVLQNFSYEIDSCYAHADEGTAYVYFDVWCPSASMIASTADEEIFDHFYKEIDFYAENPEPLTDAQKDQIRAIFAEALNDSWQDDPGFCSIDFVFEDGAWKVDEDSFASEMDMALGVW